MQQALNVGDKVFAANNQYFRITSETDHSEIVYTVVAIIHDEVRVIPDDNYGYEQPKRVENGLDDSSTPAEVPNSVVSCYGGLSSVACGFSL